MQFKRCSWAQSLGYLNTNTFQAVMCCGVTLNITVCLQCFTYPKRFLTTEIRRKTTFKVLPWPKSPHKSCCVPCCAWKRSNPVKITSSKCTARKKTKFPSWLGKEVFSQTIEEEAQPKQSNEILIYLLTCSESVLFQEHCVGQSKLCEAIESVAAQAASACE